MTVYVDMKLLQFGLSVDSCVDAGNRCCMRRLSTVFLNRDSKRLVERFNKHLDKLRARHSCHALQQDDVQDHPTAGQKLSVASILRM